MAILPWRFQADMQIDAATARVVNPDPDVTVFVGSTYTNDLTQEAAFHHDTSNPMTMKLSELGTFIASHAEGIAFNELPKRPDIGAASPPVKQEDEAVEGPAPTRKGQRR
jgi:hypothetical protein